MVNLCQQPTVCQNCACFLSVFVPVFISVFVTVFKSVFVSVLKSVFVSVFKPVFVSVFKSVFVDSRQFAKIVPALEEFEHSLRMRSV